MNEFDYKSLLEKRWRHKLTPAEEASAREWLAQHPESRPDWDLEDRLSQALGKLPDAPVPSNFTARVLQAVERESATAPPPSASPMSWFLRNVLPRAAVAAVILGAGLFTYHEHVDRAQKAANRAEWVRGVKVVAGVSSLPGPEILQDFDTIRRMSATPGPDPELIALMK
jgi:anti-sigma factor RsiW